MTRDREMALAETFVELADTLVDDFDLVDFFQQLTVRCSQLLDVSVAAVLLAPAGEPLRVVAPCDPGEALSELLEAAADEGPCVDCHTGPGAVGKVIDMALATDTVDGACLARVDLASANGRWPAFTPHARQAGYTWACALPLRLREERLGCLLLLRTEKTPLPESDVRLGQALADAAVIGLVHEQTLSAHRLTAIQLRTALDSRIVIEQAKGVLAARLGVTVDEAFNVLRRYARSNGRRLTEVAREVVEAGLVPGTEGDQALAGEP
ncbi:ANTAR domain-containing protein [Streptomyces sp. NPDC051561]|uniref:ANTAR domain-containing protein n=1 Tax=Streptomyces sp. NPDC051561 TaxID=3365658 RepID=UPI00378F3469